MKQTPQQKALHAKKISKVYKVPVGGYVKDGKVVDPYKEGRRGFARMHVGIKKGYM